LPPRENIKTQHSDIHSMPKLQRTPALTLNYEVDDFTDPWRNAPVLLLQHGNGRSSRFWYRWVPYLARHYKVVRPDMRGLGQSLGRLDLDRDITLEALIEDLRMIVAELGGDAVHFCGESMGGILGLALAALHPDLVRTLTLVATPVFIEPEMKSKYALGHASRTEAMEKMGIRAWVAETTRGTRIPADSEPDLFEWYVDEFAKGDPAVQVAMTRLVLSASAGDLLSKVRAPVLGLYPTSGQITSARQEELLKAGLKNLSLVHLPTPFHMVQLLYPKTCTDHLLAFIAGHDGYVPEGR
jgi:3-oxoadipate enol-lactonase